MASRLKFLLGAALLVLWPGAQAAPTADLWPHWSTHNPESDQAPNHHSWQQLLDKYVAANTDGINRVRYQDFTNADKTLLDAYIAELATIAPTQLSREHQLPYWINLYNALTVRVVLQHPNKDSITDMKAKFFSIGPWDERQLTLEGLPVTLNDIEHRILRPIWQDKRLHYVLNCASIGCPNLSTQAYTKENTPLQLSEAERTFLAHPRAVAFNAQGKLILSSIFDWYLEDFGGTETALLSYLAQQHGELSNQLRNYSSAIRYHYDWSLNRQHRVND